MNIPRSLSLVLALFIALPLCSEKPGAKRAEGGGKSHTAALLSRPEGHELVLKCNAFLLAQQAFNSICADTRLQSGQPLQWVQNCKTIYSELSRLHHQSYFWLEKLSYAPQYGISFSPAEWKGIAQLSQIVAAQKSYMDKLALAREKTPSVLTKIAMVESRALAELQHHYIEARTPTYHHVPRFNTTPGGYYYAN